MLRGQIIHPATPNTSEGYFSASSSTGSLARQALPFHYVLRIGYFSIKFSNGLPTSVRGIFSISYNSFSACLISLFFIIYHLTFQKKVRAKSVAFVGLLVATTLRGLQATKARYTPLKRRIKEMNKPTLNADVYFAPILVLLILIC